MKVPEENNIQENGINTNKENLVQDTQPTNEIVVNNGSAAPA